MRRFDTIAMADWSARSAPSPARPVADAIWIATRADGAEAAAYHRTRAAAWALGGIRDAAQGWPMVRAVTWVEAAGRLFPLV